MEYTALPACHRFLLQKTDSGRLQKLFLKALWILSPVKQPVTLTSYIKKSYALKTQKIQDKSKALCVLTSPRDDIRDTTIPYSQRGLLFRR